MCPLRVRDFKVICVTMINRTLLVEGYWLCNKYIVKLDVFSYMIVGFWCFCFYLEINPKIVERWMICFTLINKDDMNRNECTNHNQMGSRFQWYFVTLLCKLLSLLKILFRNVGSSIPAAANNRCYTVRWRVFLTLSTVTKSSEVFL